MTDNAKKTNKAGFGQLFSFKNLEVSKAFKSAKALFKSRNAVLLVSPDSELERGKLLCIAGRKVGKACARNRLKRLAKQIFIENHGFSKKVRFLLIFKPKCLLDRVGVEHVFRVGLSKV